LRAAPTAARTDGVVDAARLGPGAARSSVTAPVRARRRGGDAPYVHALTAIGRDVFRGSGMIVRVQRDATGRPGALVFSLSRVRELRFPRVSPP
jgi:hypothetical protein